MNFTTFVLLILKNNMNRNIIKWVIFFIVTLINPYKIIAQEKNLNIMPIAQKTTEWCWVSVCEMALKYYNVCTVDPIDYQCGLTKFLSPICSTDCHQCNVPTLEKLKQIQDVLKNYPSFVYDYCKKNHAPIKSLALDRNLSSTKITYEIDNGRPIIVTVKNGTQAVLINGYGFNPNRSIYLIVNDPWPYDQMKQTIPYLANGGSKTSLNSQYKIDYTSFVNGLQWTGTIYNIY